jgi:colanic acid/amylovoran biosynthesis glycosyltransferase
VTLLGALSRVRSDYQVVQIGTGEMQEDLCNLAGELGLSEKVSFMGAATSAVVADYMAKSDLFVLPSKTAKNGDSEAFGIVFIEAAASGLPVVATMHGGIPEAVNNGVNGLLVGEGDEVELANSIEKLLMSKELRVTFGEAGRRFVEANFDVREQSRLLDQIYMGILGTDY